MHVIKMNVVLIKECIHIYSQTENAFSVDCEWACEFFHESLFTVTREHACTVMSV